MTYSELLITAIKAPFKMMKLFALSIIFSLLGWSSASACSFSYDADYSIYEDNLSAFLTSDQTSIYIIKTSILREYEHEYKTSFHQTAVRTFLDLELELVEPLFGLIPGTSDLAVRTEPKFSIQESAIEAKYAAKPKTFGFWDRFSVSNPTIRGFGFDAGSAACGYLASNTLDANTFYLVFKSQNGRKFYEPLTGLEDEFIADFRKIIGGRMPSKRIRSAEYFFKGIDGYSDLAVSSCTADSDDGINIRDLTSEDVFIEKDKLNIDLNSIIMKDFYDYYLTGPASFPICQVGNRFLVIKSDYYNPRIRRFAFNPIFPSKLRFLKVENGVVDALSIRSNIKITNSGPVNVTDVKHWIKEGMKTKEN